MLSIDSLPIIIEKLLNIKPKKNSKKYYVLVNENETEAANIKIERQ